ncbi:uncharacterized protein LOC111910036 [Lactuca sativa]|uniref:uncharacterized protein LOC111910036 n=1 Tax=Lactuca sativa TaxID=4236 RepID=UPI000CD9DDA9|nr:uncharacterized protein LOC111910036 [Lactuca sativa]
MNSEADPVKPYRPPLPFPSRAWPEQLEQEHKNFMKKVKSLLNLVTIILNEQCSAVIMQDILTKMRDLDTLTIPCEFNNSRKTNSLVDSGASINLMPYSFYQKHILLELKITRMTIHMENRYVTQPRGIIEDLLVKIGKFVFLINFVVLDMKEDEKVPIILARPFIKIARAPIDIRDFKLILRVGDEEITFGCDPKSKLSKASSDELFFMDGVDERKYEEEQKEGCDDGSNELLELENLMDEELFN